MNECSPKLIYYLSGIIQYFHLIKWKFVVNISFNQPYELFKNNNYQLILLCNTKIKSDIFLFLLFVILIDQDVQIFIFIPEIHPFI